MRGLVLFPLLERRDSTAPLWREVVSAPIGKLPALYTTATRRVGRSPAVFAEDEQLALVRAGLSWPFAPTEDELLRIALLVHAAAVPQADALFPVLRNVQQMGDEYERHAMLRAL